MVSDVLGIETEPAAIYKNLAAEKVKLGKRKAETPITQVEQETQEEKPEKVYTGMAARLAKMYG